MTGRPLPALGMPPPHSSCHVAFRVVNLHVATGSHTSDRDKCFADLSRVVHGESL